MALLWEKSYMNAACYYQININYNYSSILSSCFSGLNSIPIRFIEGSKSSFATLVEVKEEKKGRIERRLVLPLPSGNFWQRGLTPWPYTVPLPALIPLRLASAVLSIVPFQSHFYKTGNRAYNLCSNIAPPSPKFFIVAALKFIILSLIFKCCCCCFLSEVWWDDSVYSRGFRTLALMLLFYLLTPACLPWTCS